MARLSIAGALGVTLVLAVPAAAQIREAAVTGGRVAGVVDDGIASFTGIPFAAPPTGVLRWKAPQPVKAWTGVKRATTFAPGCMQAAFATRADAPAGYSEDCLFLNVWTPARTASDRLPVMVWIHGGAFMGGHAGVPLYDGTRLAEKGVVIVSIGYRLGAFGFLAHPDLTRENGGTGSGNYGIQDQIAALQWVRDNIARFGGDPGRVTIFGESAGAISVSILAASPAAKGLFHRVISESGGNFGPPRVASEGGANLPLLRVAEANGQAFLARLGAADIAAARTLPAGILQAAVGPGLTSGFSPVFDGDLLPGDQFELYAAKRFSDTPILVGTNSDEGSTFVPPGITSGAFVAFIRAGYGPHAASILAAYPHATDDEAVRAAKDVIRDSLFAWPTWAWATLQSTHGTGRAFLYYFDHRTPQSPQGAAHAAEIAYVFRNIGAGGGTSGSDGLRPIDQAMSELMSDYWVNFAKAGDPNAPGLPPWPAFDPEKPLAMIFDNRPGARPVPNMGPIEALDAYFAWRRGEGRAGR